MSDIERARLALNVGSYGFWSCGAVLIYFAGTVQSWKLAMLGGSVLLIGEYGTKLADRMKKPRAD